MRREYLYEIVYMGAIKCIHIVSNDLLFCLEICQNISFDLGRFTRRGEIIEALDILSSKASKANIGLFFMSCKAFV